MMYVYHIKAFPVSIPPCLTEYPETHLDFKGYSVKHGEMETGKALMWLTYIIHY